MQLIGINNLIILNKLFAKLAQLIRINNLLEYSLIRIIRVDGQMNRYIDGQMNGWLDKYRDKWIDKYLYIYEQIFN